MSQTPSPSHDSNPVQLLPSQSKHTEFVTVVVVTGASDTVVIVVVVVVVVSSLTSEQSQLQFKVKYGVENNKPFISMTPFCPNCALNGSGVTPNEGVSHTQSQVNAKYGVMISAPLIVMLLLCPNCKGENPLTIDKELIKENIIVINDILGIAIPLIDADIVFVIADPMSHRA